MGLLHRLMGAVVVLLSTVGTAGCVAGILGIWMLCQGVAETVQRIIETWPTSRRRYSAG